MSIEVKIGIVVVLFLIIASSACVMTYKDSVDNVEYVVNEKESVVSGQSSTYLIFTDHETFEVSDSVAFWTFNASDRYSRIKLGKRYRFKVAGWRVPFFSMYRNIIEIKEVID